jgi:hypothetical protein
VPGGRLSCALVGLAAVAAAVSPASAAGGRAPVAPRGERVGGRTYVQWEAAAWRWQLAQLTIPAAVRDPALCVRGGQRAPVWFLNADFDRRDSVVGACVVPAGSFIFVPSPSIECSTVQPRPLRAHSNAALRRCARNEWRAAGARHAVLLDGRALSRPGFVVATPVFTFRMPARGNYLGVTGATGGRAAAFGYADMLRPLSRGVHALVRVTQFAGSAPRRTTWLLAVG